MRDLQLLKGQKVDITKGKGVRDLTIRLRWNTEHAGISVDAAAFLLSGQNRCERDEDFIFYGNPVSRDGTVSHTAEGENEESLLISLSGIPEQYARIAVTLTIYEGEQQNLRMKELSGLQLSLMDHKNGEELYRFDYGTDLSDETAVVAGELYRHQGEWKFSAVGSGFNGGLAALCKSYGLEVEPEAGNEAAATAELVEKTETIEKVLEKAEGEVDEVEKAEKVEKVENVEKSETILPQTAPAADVNVLSSIDLRKKIVGFTLVKKQLTDVKARVGIVLDITGSMRNLYSSGIVQEVVERILAVACQLDDNGSLDVWVYDTEFSRLPPVTERDLGSYVFTHIMNNDSIHKFGRNNEPPVMEDVIRKYTREEKDTTPVFIIFINDGGVVKPTKKVIMASSSLPIFWQFVGIGDSDFEVLKQLDTMGGRLVDNANFIHLDRIEEVNDEQLYDQLLNEFPQWLKAAKAKRIL
ncbi:MULTISPECIES: VWA domain-containing protein [unclassified Paenibacillus]|uniref:VWA domain-containing protein n=1 Tax=unclassified Paenibacillus TaxID=185978 RepID=UPI0009DDFBCD